MANIGSFKQYIGSAASSITLDSGNHQKYEISISVGEKDFFASASTSEQKNLFFTINDQPFQIGKTFIYETGEGISDATLKFSETPGSLIVNIVCY